MRGMEMTVVKKGAAPMDDDALIEEAIREVAGRIDGFDTDSLMGAYRAKNAPPEEMMGEGMGGEQMPAMMKENCPDCVKGECMNPEHMDEDTLQAMLAESGEGE